MTKRSRFRTSRPRGHGDAISQPARPRSPARRIVKWSAVALIWLIVAGVGILAYFAYDLPDPDSIAGPPRNPGVRVVAVDGTVLADLGGLPGEFVALEDLPAALVDAVLATEDRRFYSHVGVDAKGIGRAVFANVKAGEVVEGASTITQQLAKIVFLSPERTYRRKIQEVLLAFLLEMKFSKDEILSLYLNRAYLGAGAYGIDTAARRYFGQSARSLTLSQAAMLAGLLKAPSRYAPTRDLSLAQRRAAQVLDNMVEAGRLARVDAEAAKASPATLGETAIGGLGMRYFADWILEQVPSYVGPTQGDITVITTLDPNLQRAAEAAIRAALVGEGVERRASQGALIALSSNGAVRAMVGGTSYRESQFNRAVQARRQTGSAFKLVVYLAAFENGFSSLDVIEDASITVGDWRPRNYDDRYRGPVTLNDAFAKSINSVAVRLGQEIGVTELIKTARRLGITSALPEDLSISLGTASLSLIELTQAYGAIANGGERVLGHGIREIHDRDGRVLYRREGSGTGPIASAESVRAMTALLAEVVATGTGRAAAIPVGTVFGKTGTSQDFRDAWFVGFAEGLVAGVWVGNDDAAPMDHVTGGGLPARLWRAFMLEALSSS